MSASIDIYMPRLDVTFKKGEVPKERGSIPEIRKHWYKFCLNLAKVYKDNKDLVRSLSCHLADNRRSCQIE